MIFEFSIITGKIAKSRKIQIFKHHFALKHSILKKFHMRGTDLNTKKSTIGDFGIFEFNRGKSSNFEKSIMAISYSIVKKFLHEETGHEN